VPRIFSIILCRIRATHIIAIAAIIKIMGLIGFIFEVLVLGFMAAGIASNAAVVGMCDMLEIGGDVSIGPWRADIGGSGCVIWDKSAEASDWLLNMARVCSMMGLILGCILTFFGFFKQCLCPLPCSQIIMDISGVAVQISLALVWPMIRSDVCVKYGGCRWGGGALALFLAQIFFFVASIFTRCMREPRHERRKQQRKEQEEPLIDNGV